MSTLFGGASTGSVPSSTNSLFLLSQGPNTPNQGYNGTTSGPKQSSSSAQPTWFQNPKKRVIPNHLVPKKKAGFQISSSTSKKNSKSKLTDQKNPFNLVLFGGNSSNNNNTSINHSIHDITGTTIGGDLTKYDETINETMIPEDSLLLQDDLPPAHSMYDLNSDVLKSLNDSAINNPDSFLNKNPRSFSNIFSRSEGISTNSKASESEKEADSTKINDVNNGDKVNVNNSIINSSNTNILNNSINSNTNNSNINGNDGREAAVLVFGYPENMANEVINYFLEFGEILEQFEVTKPKNASQKYYQFHYDYKHTLKSVIPIFTGESWVKLTYTNPTSALSALQENGSVFNGVLLGVIPYLKHAVERLQKKRVENEQDIGGKLLEFLGLAITNQEVDKSIVEQTSYSNRLDVKDGALMFLHAKKPQGEDSKHKLGIIGTAAKYLFGFNEL